MKTWLLVLLLLCFPAYHAQTPGREAQVYVYSYRHVSTLGKVKPPIYLDGKQIAKLDGTRFFVININPGNHSFHLKDKMRGGINFDFKAGETYYIRLDMREGTTVGPAGLVFVPTENASFDIKQMRPIDKGDIKDPRITQSP